jgi:hypothetical protein
MALVPATTAAKMRGARERANALTLLTDVAANHKSAAVADLNQTISTHDDADIQAISDKVDELLAALRLAGLLASS